MTKKNLLFISLVMLFGCTYGKGYMEHPETFLRDPHFAEYKDKRDVLESSYLRKEITYAEYIERKEKLGNKYDQEVKERNAVIMSDE